MNKVGFQNVDAVMRKLEKHKLLVRGAIADTKRRVVRHVLTDLVKGSPQWSGNLASQWYVETNLTGPGGYRPISSYMGGGWRYDDMEPYKMGDDPAVSATLARELPKVAGIKWNTKVRIVNYAPYAEEVENNIGPVDLTTGIQREIRDVNKLASYGGVAMAAYVAMKYNNLRYIKKLAV